jgi:hypothetical protein
MFVVYSGGEPPKGWGGLFVQEPTLAGDISPTKALADSGNSKVEFPDQDEVCSSVFLVN